MAEFEPIGFYYFVGNGMRVHLSVNDIPMLQTPKRGSEGGNCWINHLLVRGENVIRAELETRGPIGVRQTTDAQGFPRLDVKVFRRPRTADAKAEGEEYEVLARLFVDHTWEGVPEEERRYPWHGRAHFSLMDDRVEPSFHAAEPASPVPCEGTPELRAAVEEIHRAYAQKDRDEVMRLSEPMFTDADRFYPGQRLGRADLMRDLTRLLGPETAFEPFDPTDLHFESRDGGRVVWVRRYDGEPVVRGHLPGNPGYTVKFDLLLIHTRQGWRAIQ